MFHILLSVKAARWENSRAQFRGRGWKFDKFQFPTNSLGQGSSTYFASDKFSISTPLLYAKRPVPSLVPLSLSLSLSFPPSFSLSLSIAYSDPYTGHSHSFCTRARIHVYTRSLMPKRCFASQTLLTSRSPTIDKMLICLEKANYTQSKHVEFGETCLIRSLARLIRRDNEARKKFFMLRF